MKHITIQAIWAKYPQMYEYFVRLGKNNNRNIFFIDPSTEELERPTIYNMWAGRLGVTIIRHDRILMRHISFTNELELWMKALAVGHAAVKDRHPYLAPVLEETEIIRGLKQSNDALF